MTTIVKEKKPNIEYLKKSIKINPAQIKERFHRIKASMVLVDLFIHEFLMMVSSYMNYLIPTMGVYIKEGRICLDYNPYFVQLLKNEEVRWVLFHEVYHIALHHITLRKPLDNQQMLLWNYAADLAVNQLIKENMQVVKPNPKIIEPLYPESFGFPKMLSMEQYLQLLWKWDENNKKNVGKDNKNNEKNVGEVIDDHSKFHENEIIDQVIRNKIEQMENQSKYWDNMSGETKQIIEAAQKSQISWRKLLRHEYGRYVINEKEPTIMRPNRRFGYPFCGKTNICVDRVLIAWDTSGSVSDKALSQFIVETNRATDYIPIDLIQFDFNIQYGPKPFDKKVKRINAQGRGGTNFNPVFELADKMHYKSLVILTDGYAPPPPKPKNVTNILWCIIEGGNVPVNWGKVIYIKDNIINR